MNTRLVVGLDENWPTESACAWVTLNQHNQLVEEGYSEPRHWPAAATCDVVIRGPQVLWLEVPIPRNARRELPRLLAFALEDSLLQDVDMQHLTLSHRRPSEDKDRDQAGVLVIAKDRLRTLTSQLTAIGRTPHRVFAEIQGAPASSEEWHLSLTSTSAILRQSQHSGVAIDLALTTTLVAEYLAGARTANRIPNHIVVHVEPGQPTVNLTGIEPLQPPVVASETHYKWWQGAAHGGINLLHGEFATRARQGTWATHLRAPVMVGAAALGLWFAASISEVLWLRNHYEDLNQRMARLYETTFPNSPAIAPAAQMRQQLAQERERHGRLRHDDALSLLGIAATALGTDATSALDGLRFEDGLLDLTLAETARHRINELVDLLAAHGVLANVRHDGKVAHLQLRAEPLQ